MTTLYIVFYDNQHGLCWPMGWASDCDGALSADRTYPVGFTSKKAAQRAIRVSREWYKFQNKRGDKGIYDDFAPEYAKKIKIIPVTVIGGEVVLKQEGGD